MLVTMKYPQQVEELRNAYLSKKDMKFKLSKSKSRQHLKAINLNQMEPGKARNSANESYLLGSRANIFTQYMTIQDGESTGFHV